MARSAVFIAYPKLWQTWLLQIVFTVLRQSLTKLQPHAPLMHAVPSGLCEQSGQIAQIPWLHVCPDGHGIPHPPQLLESLAVFTHTPEQSVCPAGHAHVPPLQIFPPLQPLPHAPQLLESLEVSTHAPEQ